MAILHDRLLGQLGFTFACQAVWSAWMLLATGLSCDESELWRLVLERIAAHQVANRPGRIEPWVIKRRRHRYPLMRAPRDELRRAASDS